MKIFLAPRSNETSYKDFLSTIENGLDYSIVEPYLPAEGKTKLSRDKRLFGWGCKETKKSTWDKMDEGDWVFFYKGREEKEVEGKLVYAGRLLYKQHSKELSLALWPPKPGEEPWSCVFFLNELKQTNIPISEIAKLSGYSKNFIVQGMMPLNEKGLENILEKYENVEKFISEFSEDVEEAESDLEESNEISAHEEAELLLLKIGRLLGYDTYTPDKNKQAYGELLSDYVNIDKIPTRFLGPDIEKIVREIDVIWFEDEVPKYAFEVEHTTKFGSGFQRLCQLVPLNAKLFIVSSAKNSYLFDKFISTDPYYKYSSNFKFKDYKKVEKYFSAVSEFSAIKDAFLK